MPFLSRRASTPTASGDDPPRRPDPALLVELAEPTQPTSPTPTGHDRFRPFGLHRNPFADSIDPRMFYQTNQHAEALERMLMAVEHDISVGMVTGHSGTGKTLLTQILLERMDPDHVDPVLILVSPGLSRTGLLRDILAELNIPLPIGISRLQDLLRLLGNHIIDLHEQHRKLVLLIDECHLLHADNLHLLRTISNIELPERKLSTILLFGESRFARRLEHPSYESLRNRMYFRAEIRPMEPEECAQYVKFRLMVSGRLEPLFTEEALARLHTHSGGIGRNINKVGMLCLLEAGRRGLSRIDEDLVQACAEHL
jgi:type II secretory pathway predicted ATPase ExeA